MKSYLDTHNSKLGNVTDKWENCINTYNKIFENWHDKPLEILEIGVQNGGSLEVLAQYFHEAKIIVGCDINQKCSEINFSDERIKIVIGDATCDQAFQSVKDLAASFDIIFDDGSHTSRDIVVAFLKYFPLLSENGLYVVEDLHCSYWAEFEGGLYHPYSSIQFFKYLVDVINHESWNTNCNLNIFLAPILNHYGINCDLDCLKEIHSIQFVNSICIVEKRPRSENVLGKRILKGDVSSVFKANVEEIDHSIIYDQKNNYWSNIAIPDEYSDSTFRKIVEYNNSEVRKTISMYEAKIADLTKSFEEVKIRLEAKINDYALHSDNLQHLFDDSNRKLKSVYSSLAFKISYPIRIAENRIWPLISRNTVKRIIKAIFKSTYGELALIRTRCAGIQLFKPVRNRIIVYSHNAFKEGAPILALNIISELVKKYNYDVVVLIGSGGPLAREFKKLATIYRLDLLRPKIQKSIFFTLSANGFKSAICNTSLSGGIVETLKDSKIKSVCLIHELPYVIEELRLQNSLVAIESFANKVIYPSGYVRTKLKDSFGFNPNRYDLLPQGRFKNNKYIDKKELARKTVKDLLKIPLKSDIIIGVGTGERRKGIDLFVKTGIEHSKRNSGVCYIWIGGVKPDLADYIVSLIEASGLNDNFRFVSFTDEIDLYYSAADLFFLSSREDPFPSVYIDSLYAGLPAVAFSNGGGFVDFHKSIGGTLVDSFDTLKAAEANEELLTNYDLYKAKSESAANASVLFDFKKYVGNIIAGIGEKPLCVSVIVPNYNYGAHIEERLNSILRQKYRPHEIIFLDDNSTDNSLEIARCILEKSHVDYKIIVNDTNQGCYKQWVKGVSLATGDLIWIAEADDVADVKFLSELVPYFKDDDVNLAYCQSVAIDSKSKRLNFSYVEYTNELSTTRWNESYKNNGVDEIVKYFSRLNIVPNASGALIRREAFSGLHDLIDGFNMCGDWIAYMYVLRYGKICFHSKKLNYHRRHENSIIHSSYMKPRLLVELINIFAYIFKNYSISHESKKIIAKRISDYYQLREEKFQTITDDESILDLMHSLGLSELVEYLPR